MKNSLIKSKRKPEIKIYDGVEGNGNTAKRANGPWSSFFSLLEVT